MTSRRPQRGPKFIDSSTSGMPHIGEMLQQYFTQKRTHQAALARAIQRAPITLYEYKKNHSIQAAILWDLSHALKYNFFADLAAALPAGFDKASLSEVEEKNDEVIALRAEVAQLKKEKELLMEVLKAKG